MNAAHPQPIRRDWRSLPVVLVLSLDAAVTDRVAAALAGLARVHRADPAEETVQLPLIELKPVLTLVDVQDAGQGLTSLLASLKRHAPTAGLVALGDDGAADLILQCMRSGANDFIDRQTGDSALRRALRGRLERGSREAVSDRQGPVFGVFGARSSDPSRLYAIALATARAQADRRVLFLDLAGGSQESAIALDITPSYGVSDAIIDLDRLDQALLSSAVPHHASRNISALLLDPEIPAQSLSGGDVTTLLILLRGIYDEVVLHASAPLLVDMPMLLSGLRRVALLTTQNLASAQAAAQCLRKLADQGIGLEERAVLVVADYLANVLPAPNVLGGSIGVGEVIPIADQRARLWNALNQGRFVDEALAERGFARCIIQLAEALGAEVAAPPRSLMQRLIGGGGRK